MISRTNFVIIGLIAFINAQADSQTTREPSIQAYGLPKRFFTDNGYIERFYLGNVAEEKPTGETAKVDGYFGNPGANIRRKFVPKDEREDGTIEIIHLDSSEKDESSTKSNLRNRRAIEKQESSNIGENMQAEESKVFRPLFVYRQQVAKRQRIQREKAINRDMKPRYYSKNNNFIQYYPQLG